MNHHAQDKLNIELFTWSILGLMKYSILWAVVLCLEKRKKTFNNSQNLLCGYDGAASLCEKYSGVQARSAGKQILT